MSVTAGLLAPLLTVGGAGEEVLVLLALVAEHAARARVMITAPAPMAAFLAR
ncbi:MAG TPA: hypothetical protein VMV92_43610 [Streptosporangiaceae bacterium]|nr:hypothetical protein [Streptosporangiaceae bacterium]